MDPTTRCQKLQRSTTDPDYNEQNAKEKHLINQITRENKQLSVINQQKGKHRRLNSELVIIQFSKSKRTYITDLTPSSRC